MRSLLQRVLGGSGRAGPSAAASLLALQADALSCSFQGLASLAAAGRRLCSAAPNDDSGSKRETTALDASTAQSAAAEVMATTDGAVAAVPKDRRKSSWSAAARQVLGGKSKAKRTVGKGTASRPEGGEGGLGNAGVAAQTAVEAGPPPGSPAGPSFTVFEQLKHLDPLLQAVALVPWLPDNAEGKSRRTFIVSTVLDQLESKGWDVRGPVNLMWQGERDLATVLEGKDSGTRAAVTAIMYHCKKLDEELGDFRNYGAKQEPQSGMDGRERSN